MAIDNIIDHLTEIRDSLHITEKKFISHLNFAIKAIMTYKLYEYSMIEMNEEIFKTRSKEDDLKGKNVLHRPSKQET
jgi:hypothetical protein